MIRLEPVAYQRVEALYRAHDAFYPLIVAVLKGDQNGVVYADDPVMPSQAYVEHAFGFAQIIGRSNGNFESALQRYLLVDKQFESAKVRLYTPGLPAFLAAPENDSMRSWRQRFILDDLAFRRCLAELPALDHRTSVERINAGNIEEIEKQFNVVRRFWRTPDDFIQKARAVTVLRDGVPAALCYAAAEADGQLEIDVLTAPEHRSLGLAKLVTAGFIEQSLDLALRPLWDCFTNNDGSMALCRSIGFVLARPAYAFYTIAR